MKKRRKYLFNNNSTLPEYSSADTTGDQLPLEKAETNNLGEDIDINAENQPSIEFELTSYDLWMRMQAYKFL